MLSMGGHGRRKYRNKPVTVDGQRFDSRKEARRWADLKLLEQAREIFELRTQVRFPLEVQGELVCTYVADFVYREAVTGEVVVEDVKSEATRKNPAYRIKNKLFRAIHGFEITEV